MPKSSIILFFLVEYAFYLEILLIKGIVHPKIDPPIDSKDP